MRKNNIWAYILALICAGWFEYEVLDGSIPWWFFVPATLITTHHSLHMYDHDKEYLEAAEKIKPVVKVWVFIMCIGIVGLICSVVNSDWIQLMIFIFITIVSIAILFRYTDESEDADGYQDKEYLEATEKIKPAVKVWVLIMCIGIIGSICSVVNSDWIQLMIFIFITIVSVAILFRHTDESEDADG